MIRENKVAEVSISNFCNFSCDYCISKSTHKKIPRNPDGSPRIFRDLRYNEKGMVDHRRVKKYGLLIRGGFGNTYNFGVINSDGVVERDGDHVIETDFIDYDKLIVFIRKNLSDWVIQVGGGEPLHNPGICDFLLELSKTNKIILMTNLSLIKANMPILEIPSERMFYRVGFHPEQYPIEKYLSNIDILVQHNKKYLINYVLHPRNIESGIAKAHVDVLKDNDIDHEVTRFHGEWDGVMYPTKEISGKEIELLSPHSIEYPIKFNVNTPGTTYMSIYPDGNIYQCSKQSSCLGNIYRSIDWTHKVPMTQCFKEKTLCQSVVSQEYVFNNCW